MDHFKILFSKMEELRPAPKEVQWTMERVSLRALPPTAHTKRQTSMGKSQSRPLTMSNTLTPGTEMAVTRRRVSCNHHGEAAQSTRLPPTCWKDREENLPRNLLSPGIIKQYLFSILNQFKIFSFSPMPLWLSPADEEMDQSLIRKASSVSSSSKKSVSKTYIA